ncbi:MAG: hypothetical protein L6V90_07040 [Treponema succinifaciens]|nr:MAG: hypothetical protein L6V90_07040 [Treponema succinifaciens]
MNIRIPPSIKKGCTIAVTAPSFGCTTEPYTSRFNFAKKKFESLGYKIFAGETVFQKATEKEFQQIQKKAAKELEEFYCSDENSRSYFCRRWRNDVRNSWLH